MSEGKIDYHTQRPVSMLFDPPYVVHQLRIIAVGFDHSDESSTCSSQASRMYRTTGWSSAIRTRITFVTDVEDDFMMGLAHSSRSTTTDPPLPTPAQIQNLRQQAKTAFDRLRQELGKTPNT
jgi:hypothetical protein